MGRTLAVIAVMLMVNLYSVPITQQRVRRKPSAVSSVE